MSTLLVVLETKSAGVGGVVTPACALSPLTGSIVSLGMYDIERELGAVYYQGKEEDWSDESFSYKLRNESELLSDWWEGAPSYDVLVTFNGRSFTIPFLYHRSAILQIKPTVEIANGRYLTKQTLPYQVDLLEELSFNRAMSPTPSLAVLCQVYGISFRPLVEDERAEILLQQNFRALAEHNAQKLLAIKQLYEIWKVYFASRAFLNGVEL
jgi:hypothetical protein